MLFSTSSVIAETAALMMIILRIKGAFFNEMNYLKLRLTRAFFISLLCAIVFGLIALLISDKKIAGFDNTVSSFIQGLKYPTLTSIMKFFTFIGAGYPVVFLTMAIIFFLYKFLHLRKELILFVWVVNGTVLLNWILKILFHRARPTIHRIIDANGFSFPSGHSMLAFSLYGIITFLLWRHVKSSFGRGILILISTIMIIAIGLSRIYLGVHYPSDVLGGYLASGAWLAASIWTYQYYIERHYKAKIKLLKKIRSNQGNEQLAQYVDFSKEKHS